MEFRYETFRDRKLRNDDLLDQCIRPKYAPDSEVLKVDPNTEKGFSYPYYLYVPSALRETAQKDKLHSFLVIPNNTGQISDDFAFHEADVKRKLPAIGPFMKTNGVVAPLLMPVFPRPATEYRIYTQSLDRDSMLTDKKEFSRFDLQLIAMIKDAQARLKKDGIKTEKKVLMQGYSASGMFVNRFVFLHPHLVKAAIVGSPGGWALAPVSTFGKKALTFPVGTYDLKEISGKKFDLKALRTVPLFFILGGSDTNDAVPKGDAYDRRETDLVMELFGKTPVERFPVSQKLYSEAGLNAEFKLYPNTPHQMSKEMRDDQIAFLKKHVLN
jgi:hypothetical protein